MNPQFTDSAVFREPSEAFAEVDSTVSEHIRLSVQRHLSTGRHTYSITQKIPGGIRHATGWAGHTKPSVSELIIECAHHGIVSPRPYHLEQPHDTTICTCVWALYANYCRKTDCNPTDLLHRAYPSRGMEPQWTPEIWSDVLERAEWEGTYFPRRWSQRNTGSLFRALHLLDAPFLVYLLETKARTGPLDDDSATLDSDRAERFGNSSYISLHGVSK